MPNYLPPPRSIVHTSRGKRNQHDFLDPVIRDDATIPHSNSYSALLANSTSFRRCLLQYLTENFGDKSKTVTRNYNFSVTIDSPLLPFLVTIHRGQSENKPPNQHGEADYAIWHHCICEISTTILVVSSDTDTWVYGLGLCQLGYLRGKTIVVQRGNVDSYINITRATSLLSQHPKLQHLNFPVLTLVALYILTGCDYVSAFYRYTKSNFLETLLRCKSFICSDGHLFRMINGEFQYIKESAWLKLVTAVYYDKFKKFFRSKDVEHTYQLITKHQDSPEAKRMLSSLHFTTPTTANSDLALWDDFIRRVTYHVPTVSKYHEHKLLPSYQALVLHAQRANYVLKLALSTPWTMSPFLPCFLQFGWHVDNDIVLIKWDDSTEVQEQDSECEDDSEPSNASDISDF